MNKPYIEFNGNSRNNKFILRGPEHFSGNSDFNIYATDVVINGGGGIDKAIIKNADQFDRIIAFDGFADSGREISFLGSTESHISESGKKLSLSHEQGVTLYETVEQIKINGTVWDFDELFDKISSDGFVPEMLG